MQRPWRFLQDGWILDLAFALESSKKSLTFVLALAKKQYIYEYMYYCIIMFSICIWGESQPSVFYHFQPQIS